MKLGKLFLLPSIAVILSMTSCSNDDAYINDSSNVLTVHYAGKTFENVLTTYDSNGEFVFHDNELASLYKSEIATMPEMSIFMISDYEIGFYRNWREALEDQGLTILKGENIASRSASYAYRGSVALFDDKGCKDRRKDFSISYPDTYLEVPDLKIKEHKFNDKCSAVELCNNLPNTTTDKINLNGTEFPCCNIELVMIGFDDKKFTDRSYICVAKAGSVRRYDQLSGFNDKMSSLRLLFAQKDQYHDTHYSDGRYL